jgi:hypothetical protein
MKNLNNVFGMPLKSHWVFKAVDQLQPGEVNFKLKDEQKPTVIGGEPVKKLSQH